MTRKEFCVSMATAIVGAALPDIAFGKDQEQRLRPLIKYRGGKSKEFPQYERFIPKDYETYYEPFVGGGATYFAIAPQRAVIGDINEPLINFYQDVRNRFEDLSRELAEIEEIYERNQRDYKVNMLTQSKNCGYIPSPDKVRAFCEYSMAAAETAEAALGVIGALTRKIKGVSFSWRNEFGLFCKIGHGMSCRMTVDEAAYGPSRAWPCTPCG